MKKKKEKKERKPRFDNPPITVKQCNSGKCKGRHEYIFNLWGRYGYCKKCGDEILT